MESFFVFIILGYVIINIGKYAIIKIKNEMKFYMWLKKEEPIYRTDDSIRGYPRDWQFRRMAIFKKNRGICQNCGKKVGHLWNTWFYDLGRFNFNLVHVAHAHHKKRISQGGGHELTNLELLCERCHQSEHPNVLFTRSR